MRLRFELWRFVGRALRCGSYATPLALDATPMQSELLLEVAERPEKPGEPPQVLRGCCEQDLVPDAAQAPQPEAVEPENPFHVRKSHLNLLAFAARLLEGFGIG